MVTTPELAFLFCWLGTHL